MALALRPRERNATLKITGIIGYALVIAFAAASAGEKPAVAQQGPKPETGLTIFERWPPGTLPFDFSDEFYTRNGIDPTKLKMVKDGTGPASTLEPEAPDENHNNVRILAHNAGYDAAGALLYYPDPPAFFDADAFQNNHKGEAARELADRSRVFAFPKKDGNPFSPAPPNRRQDNIFETTQGYLTHNPLALWRLFFVEYTDAALNTPEGQAKMEELKARNGVDLDGTAIIKRNSEVIELERLGFVTVTPRPADGSEGPPWVV